MSQIEKGFRFQSLLSCLTALFVSSAFFAGSASGQKPSGKADAKEGQKQTSAASGQTAGAGEWDKIVKAAEGEGKVVMAGPPGNFWRDALATGFNQAYPNIKVEYQGMSSRDSGPKIISEQKANQFLWDLTVGGANPTISHLIPAGAVQEIPRDLPETAPKKNDDKWQSGFEFGFLDNAAKYNYAFLAEIVPIFINTKFVPKDSLKTAKDLLKPEFNGKITWDNPTKAGAGNFLAQTMVFNEGEQFIKNLFTKQKIMVTEDLRQQAEWLVRGTHPIAIGTSNNMLLGFTKQGLTKDIIGLYDPKSGLNGYSQSFGTISLLKNSPHPNATKVYLNWILSKEGQISVTNSILVNSRRLDVPVVNKDSFLPAGMEMPLMGKEKYEPYRLKAIEAMKESIK